MASFFGRYGLWITLGPKEGKFTMAELRSYIVDEVKLIKCPDGQFMFISLTGLTEGLFPNKKASNLAGVPIYGPAVVGSAEEMGVLEPTQERLSDW